MLDMHGRLEIEIPAETREKIENLLAGLDGAAATVLAKALNAGMMAARSAMVRLVTQKTGIAAAVVRERVWGKRAGRLGSQWSRARGGRIGWPLDLFPAHQEAGGVRVDLPGGSILFPHAFIIKPGSSLEGMIFRREGKARLPIERARTDAVTDAVLNVAGEPRVAEAGRAACFGTLEVETNKLLEKLTR